MKPSKIEEAILAYRNRETTAELNAVFYRKNSEYIPLENMEIKNDSVKVYYRRDGELRSAYPSPDDLFENPPRPYIIERQSPSLHVGDYIKFKTRMKKIAPYSNRWIKEQHKNFFQIERITSRGFYILNEPTQSLISEDWITPITRDEYEESKLTKPVMILVEAMLKKQTEEITELERAVSSRGQEYQNVLRQLENALQLRNKSKDKIIDEKFSLIKHDLAHLQRDSRVQGMDINSDGSIVIMTNPIFLTNVNIPLLKKYSQLPPYKIVVPLNSGPSNIHVENLKPLNDFGINFQSHCHPHVNSRGSLCMGTIAPAITSALAKFEIAKTFKYVMELLESYNSGNPYIKVSKFYRDALTCEGCDDPVVTERCEYCGRIQKFKEEDLIMPKF